VRALQVKLALRQYLTAKTLGRFTDAALFGALSGVRQVQLPPPALPGPHWVRLEVLRAGICGTDVSTLVGHSSPALEPFSSFPAVLGHEILGRVLEVGPQVRGFEPGQKVAVDPVISCQVRGVAEGETCAWCRAGRPATCARHGDEGPLRVDGSPLARGGFIGFHRSLPGGWGEQLVAHQAQLFAVDEGLSDRAAVLTEPLAVALHAVLGVRLDVREPVLVIGSGPIALCTLWALRAVGFGGEVLSQLKRPAEAALAMRLGASGTVAPGPPARAALERTGAKVYAPPIGPPVYAGGGFPVIFDCVGSRQSIDQALRFAAPRGRLLLLGCAPVIPRLDLTPLWARELEVRGFVAYGRERFEGRERHTFEVVGELLRRATAPVEALVTHEFPLADYQQALQAAHRRGKSGAMKVVLRPAAPSTARGS
jgi:threonine dehydrogenase-like Zn-dependent dehydrogenase